MLGETCRAPSSQLDQIIARFWQSDAPSFWARTRLPGHHLPAEFGDLEALDPRARLRTGGDAPNELAPGDEMVSDYHVPARAELPIVLRSEPGLRRAALALPSRRQIEDEIFVCLSANRKPLPQESPQGRLLLVF
jgi:hypothetical protein